MLIYFRAVRRLFRMEPLSVQGLSSCNRLRSFAASTIQSPTMDVLQVLLISEVAPSVWFFSQRRTSTTLPATTHVRSPIAGEERRIEWKRHTASIYAHAQHLSDVW